MLVDIVMPKMGESIMEGTILKWLKQPGDKVERDEAILEISTDKVDTEVPSPESGIIAELLFKENDVVEVGSVLAKLETDSSAPVAAKEAPAEAPKADVKKDEPVKVEAKTAEPAPAKAEAPKEEIPEGSGFYSPLVLNIAKKEGIGFGELASIKGTGLQGRVTKKDILEYIANRGSKPAAKPEAPAVKAQPAPAKPKP